MLPRPRTGRPPTGRPPPDRPANMAAVSATEQSGATGSTAVRSDGRAPDQLRPVRIDTGFMRTATGSVLMAAGGTRVICTASAGGDGPRRLKGARPGWGTPPDAQVPAPTGERQ